MFQLDQGFYQTLKVKMVVLLLSTACFPWKETVLSIDQSKYCKQVTSKNRYFSTHNLFAARVYFSSQPSYCFPRERLVLFSDLFGLCLCSLGILALIPFLVIVHARSTRKEEESLLCEIGQTRPRPQNETLTFGLSLKWWTVFVGVIDKGRRLK